MLPGTIKDVRVEMIVLHTCRPSCVKQTHVCIHVVLNNEILVTSGFEELSSLGDFLSYAAETLVNLL